MIFGLAGTFLAALVLGLSVPDETADRFAPCLPQEELEEVSVTPSKRLHKLPAANVTVRERLRQLRARCKKRKLVDAAGREIRIYRLIGCWGNPPEDYQEQLARQGQELQRLKKKYTVVEIPCAQVDPRQIQ